MRPHVYIYHPNTEIVQRLFPVLIKWYFLLGVSYQKTRAISVILNVFQITSELFGKPEKKLMQGGMDDR